MRTTAFITLAIASLLFSAFADARVINERDFSLTGKGGRGGSGGDGGKGGDNYAPGGAAAPGGPGGPGAVGGNGGDILPGATAINGAPALPALPDASTALAGLPLGAVLASFATPADKRSVPTRRRLIARAGTLGTGGEGQVKAQGVPNKGQSDSSNLAGLGVTDAVKGALGKLSLGKREATEA